MSDLSRIGETDRSGTEQEKSQHPAGNQQQGIVGEEGHTRQTEDRACHCDLDEGYAPAQFVRNHWQHQRTQHPPPIITRRR